MATGVNVLHLLNSEMQSILDQDNSLQSEVDITGLSRVEASRNCYNHARAFWNQGGPSMHQRMDLKVPGQQADINCRLHIPVQLENETQVPVVLFSHGGSWMLGNLDTHDRVMRELANRGGFAVLGVDYRLAPEASYDDMRADVMAVLRYVRESGDALNLNGNNIALAGDSAGAQLSLCTALDDDTTDSRLKALVLIYGAYGLADSVSRRLYGGKESGLDEESMIFSRQCLLGKDADPIASGFDLLRRDLSTLPASLVTSCTLDPLCDDSLALVKFMQCQGVSHE
ncbi:MAG: acetyl esterase, partial [Gammaproteobacteria bacterium]